MNPEDIGARVLAGAQREKTITELLEDSARSLESAQQLVREVAGALVGSNRPIRGVTNQVGEVADESVRGRAFMLERQLSDLVREIEDVKRSVYPNN